MRLLVVEDDGDLLSAIVSQMEKAGFEADACTDGADAEYYLNGGGYNAVVLDRMLPGKDGLSILRGMRATGDDTPVLLLTALGEISDRTDGLDAGADDYLVKPFAMAELIARVRALTRRPAAMRHGDLLTFADMTLDVRCGVLSRGASVQTLSKKELAVLELFFEAPERVRSRAEILSRGWGGDEDVSENSADNYIYFLRRRLRACGTGAAIVTVHGRGYALTENPS